MSSTPTSPIVQHSRSRAVISPLSDNPIAAHNSFDDQKYEDYLQPVPPEAKTTSLWGQFWVWFGANVAPINWVLGALGVQMGLGLWQTFAVIAIGNLIGMSIFGILVLLGQRTGLTAMLLGRRVFGRVGNYLPSLIQSVVVVGWCSVNTWVVLDLITALLVKIGFIHSTEHHIILKAVIGGIVMIVQVLIAMFGYHAIATFEKWTVPPTIAILVLMTIATWGFLDVDWNYAGQLPLGSTDQFAAISTVMTAIGIGWGFTWLTYACDYSRFVSTSVPRSKLFLTSILGQFIPVCWLGLLGATLATKSGTVDPGQLIVNNFGALAIPVLLLVVHGPIATNILNIYSFTLSVQSLDIKINRRLLNIVVGIFAWCGVLLYLNMSNIGDALDGWLSSVAGWTAVWGGIMLVHFHIVEPKTSDFSCVLQPIKSSTVPLIRWQSLVAFFIGLVMCWATSYGAMFQGPIATAMGGIDLSWLGAIASASGVYWIFSMLTKRKVEL